MPATTALTDMLAPLEGVVARPLLDLALADGRPVSLRPGHTLFRAGEPALGIHLIASGAIRVTRDTPSRSVVIHREGSGGMLGEIALFTGAPYPGTAVALEPSCVVFLAERVVRTAMSGDPKLASLFLHRVASRARDVIERLDRIANLTVARRLALHLSERAGGAPRNIITLGMTQVQLAEELGTVKEVITRELRALVKLRVLAPRGRGQYAVLDENWLRHLAGENGGPRRSRTPR
jgi:CRP/FNR family transcriptional regulator, dissimilatory nitrate respiration regulator